MSKEVVLLVWAVQWEVPHVDLVQREPTAKKERRYALAALLVLGTTAVALVPRLTVWLALLVLGAARKVLCRKMRVWSALPAASAIAPGSARWCNVTPARRAHGVTSPAPRRTFV